MKLRRFKHDLGLKLMALYTLFVGPVVVSILLIANSTQTHLEENIKAADLALARSIAQETDLAMRNAMTAVRGLKTYPSVIDSNPDNMKLLFSTVMSARPDIDLVYRLDPQGFMLFHYPMGPNSTIGNDFSSQEYFQRTQITTKPIISKGYISPTTNQPITTAAISLWDSEANFLGAIATDIELKALSQTLVKISQEYDPEECFEVVTVDSNNQIVAHPNTDKLLQQIPESLSNITEPLLLGRADTIISTDENGIERLYSYVPISSAGWGVIVSRPTAKAFAIPRTFFRGSLIALTIFSIIGIFFWISLTQLVIQPLGNIAAYSHTIGQKEPATQIQKDTLVSIATQPDQMGRLARSLIRMEEAIESRLNELSTLLQTSASVVSSLDHEIVLNRILEQVEYLMNVKMSAIVALDEKKGFFRVQASRGISKQFADQIAINPGDSYSVTLEALRRSAPFQVNDIEKSMFFHDVGDEGYRSILTIPLNTQYAPQSALLIFRPDPHTFTLQEIDLLSNFANHATMAIENAALYARSDMRLQEQTRRIEALIQSINDGIIFEGSDGRVIYANRRISDLTNLTLTEITGAKINTVFEHIIEKANHPDEARENICLALESHGERETEIELYFQGRTIWLRLYTFNVTDTNGMPIGQGQLLNDITAYHELDRMKSNLISAVSHELRTPLASIKGYASTLLADDVEWDIESQQEFLSIISDEADQLSTLVSELLDLSRIEAGKLTVKRQLCHLEDIVNFAAQRAVPKPNQRLRVNIPDDLAPIYVDRRRMEVVLRNLIENAAKYAGDQSPIFIKASFDEENVIIQVKDEGPGIPDNERQNIFDCFHNTDKSLTNPVSGSGLGLAICQGFVQAHGGDIWLEPKEQGACFTITLPYHPTEG